MSTVVQNCSALCGSSTAQKLSSGKVDSEIAEVHENVSKGSVRKRRVGGRFWKRHQKRPASWIGKGGKQANPNAWSKRDAARKKRRVMKQAEADLRQAAKEKREEERKKREDREKRRAENEFKSSSFQIMKNTQKMKKMSKKQLRMIKRRRMRPDGVMELVSPWSS